MSPSYVVTLALVALGLLVLRLAAALPSPSAARALGRVDALIALVGLSALLYHCIAMFFPDLGRAVPGGVALAPVIDDLGVASALLFILPAAVLLVGIRRLHPVAVVVDALALVAVGVTMYDGGPLVAHLSAIAVAVVALAVTGFAFVSTIGPAAFVQRPARGSGSRGRA